MCIGGYFAVIAIDCPFPSGLTKGDGDHRDVTVHKDMVFSLSCQLQGETRCFCHVLGLNC